MSDGIEIKFDVMQFGDESNMLIVTEHDYFIPTSLLKPITGKPCEFWHLFCAKHRIQCMYAFDRLFISLDHLIVFTENDHDFLKARKLFSEKKKQLGPQPLEYTATVLNSPRI
jgi:hypothetical protein